MAKFRGRRTNSSRRFFDVPPEFAPSSIAGSAARCVLDFGRDEGGLLETADSVVPLGLDP
jgi:hypothetical protein